MTRVVRAHDAAIGIRPLHAADFPGVRAVHEVVRMKGATDGGPEADSEIGFTPTLFATCLEDGCSHVAIAAGTVSGYLLTRALAYDGDAPLTLWVEGLAIHPDWRRRGIAAALYRALGAGARAAGVKAILARLAPDDAEARAIHEGAGFEPHRGEIVIWRLGEG